MNEILLIFILSKDVYCIKITNIFFNIMSINVNFLIKII